MMPIQQDLTPGWNGTYQVRRIGYKRQECVVKRGLTTTDALDAATMLDELNTAFAKGAPHTVMFVVEPERIAVSG